jgi:hypothetical protein
MRRTESNRGHSGYSPFPRRHSREPHHPYHPPQHLPRPPLQHAPLHQHLLLCHHHRNFPHAHYLPHSRPPHLPPLVFPKRLPICTHHDKPCRSCLRHRRSVMAFETSKSYQSYSMAFPSCPSVVRENHRGELYAHPCRRCTTSASTEEASEYA